MADLIDRQAAIGTAVKAAVDWHKLANPQYSIAYCIGEAMRGLPSAQPEPLTDKEQRIFLAAMAREEEVCRKTDDECRDCREPYEDSLVRTCHEITKKVRGALWTI